MLSYVCTRGVLRVRLKKKVSHGHESAHSFFPILNFPTEVDSANLSLLKTEDFKFLLYSFRLLELLAVFLFLWEEFPTLISLCKVLFYIETEHAAGRAISTGHPGKGDIWPLLTSNS